MIKVLENNANKIKCAVEIALEGSQTASYLITFIVES